MHRNDRDKILIDNSSYHFSPPRSLVLGALCLGMALSIYTTNPAPLGRALPPCTDGSAHHFADSRRTPS